MGEERILPHKLQLSERKFLSMTGVVEVISLDESQVVLRTGLGLLQIHGQGLQLKMLTPQGGEVAVEGSISALIYQQNRQGGGFFGRLLR